MDAAADTQLGTLVELIRHCKPDEDGSIYLRQRVLVESLEQIRADHQRELQMLPEVAGRLVGCLSGFPRC